MRSWIEVFITPKAANPPALKGIARLTEKRLERRLSVLLHVSRRGLRAIRFPCSAPFQGRTAQRRLVINTICRRGANSKRKRKRTILELIAGY